MRHELPDLLPDAAARWRNVIVRPLAHDRGFIQLDDLSPAVLERVRPLSLFTLQTSPSGTQAWLALDAPHDREFQRRVKRAVETVDCRASGATRLPGSRNFKLEYAPPEALEELRPAYRDLAEARARSFTEHEAEALSAIASIKARYAPRFPLVAMTYCNPGHVVTKDHLQSLGLVAPPEVFAPPRAVSLPHPPAAALPGRVTPAA